MLKTMKGDRCTVGDAVKAGVTRGDIQYDVDHKYIEVVNAVVKADA
jgi:hypothetical protein